MLSEARYKYLNWGRKTGKTEYEIEELIGIATLKEFNHGKTPKLSYIGETRKEAKRIAWDRAKQRTKPIWYKQPNESNLELYLKRNDDLEFATIFFDGWENVDALIGEEFDHLCLDEVAKFKDFIQTFKNVLRPTLTPRKGGATFISRPQGYNHWHVVTQEAQFKQKEGKNYFFSHATSFDNPFIDATEIEEAREDLDDDTFAQEYLADFRKVTGLVYKEFDRNRHVINDDELQRFRSIGIVDRRSGIDWGWNNPASAHPIEKNTDAIYCITDEFYESFQDTDDIIDNVKAMNVSSVYPDSAEADRVDLCRRKGLTVKAVSKDVKAGIGTVQKLFRQNRLLIHESCTFLITELEGYRWKDKKKDANEPEEPVKENDHGCDDTRYCLHMWENTESDTDNAVAEQKKRMREKAVKSKGAVKAGLS